MITIHLDQHSRAEVRAELDEEYGATVVLSLDFEEHELGRWRALSETIAAEQAREAFPLEVDLDDPRDRLAAAYEAEVKRVVEMLERERDLTRTLLPDEARELAAMLWHYADRAEAPK